MSTPEHTPSPHTIKQPKGSFLPTSNSFSFSFSLNFISKSCKYWQCSDCRSSCNFLTAAWCWVSFRETRKQHRGHLAYDKTMLPSSAIAHWHLISKPQLCPPRSMLSTWECLDGGNTNGTNREGKLSRLHQDTTAGN